MRREMEFALSKRGVLELPQAAAFDVATSQITHLGEEAQIAAVGAGRAAGALKDFDQALRFVFDQQRGEDD